MHSFYILQILNLKFTKKRHDTSKKLKLQEQLVMHSFYILQILNLKFTKKDMDTQKN